MVTVLVDRWRMHPLAWIHRAEARAVARELRRAGRSVAITPFDGVVAPPSGPLLLRLSDPEMLRAAAMLRELGVPYRGPSASALARCYDKWTACEAVRAYGLDCPLTRLATNADDLPRPLVLKPRQGSDSLGLRVVRASVPQHLRSEHMLVQAFVCGTELTVGVIDGMAGMPLQLRLAEGKPLTFSRKYLLRPGWDVTSDTALAARARAFALEVSRVLGADWAARVDLIRERGTGKLMFLECDAAPLIGPASSFAVSLAAAGMARDELLARLLGER